VGLVTLEFQFWEVATLEPLALWEVATIVTLALWEVATLVPLEFPILR